MKVFGKWLNVICSSILQKHRNNDIGVKYPYSEWSPPLKTGVTLTIFKSSGNISFSSDKSNINFKEVYSSPKHFLATLKLILLQPQHLGRCSLSVRPFLRNSSGLSKIILLRLMRLFRLFIIKQNLVSSAICFELSFENRVRNK